jgi:hypothetical protein
MTHAERKNEPAARIRWQGEIQAVQCRAWVWRYRTDNRTHHHLGFNLWVKGEAGDHPGKFIVAISDSQQRKLQLRIGDGARGTAWPCEKAKHDIADLYRAGGLRIISRLDAPTQQQAPPFVGTPPPLEVFEARGARMLDPTRWRNECMTCVWANKSAVEIEYNFGKSKRYRTETFCYGPKSCRLYERGEPRPVPYYGEDFASVDDGGLDDCCTGHRGGDE